MRGILLFVLVCGANYWVFKCPPLDTFPFNPPHLSLVYDTISFGYHAILETSSFVLSFNNSLIYHGLWISLFKDAVPIP